MANDTESGSSERLQMPAPDAAAATAHSGDETADPAWPEKCELFINRGLHRVRVELDVALAEAGGAGMTVEERIMAAAESIFRHFIEDHPVNSVAPTSATLEPAPAGGAATTA